MKSFKNYIAERISEASGVEKARLIELIEVPPSPEMGDLAFPCYALARELRKPPALVAADLITQIGPDEIVRRVEAAGPYVNFHLRHETVIARTLGVIASQKGSFGKNTVGAGKTIVIDYSSPNIAKPFGIGHLRSTVIGAALKRIYQYQGYNVVGINHLGDWGTQFGKVILAFKLWGDSAKLKESPIQHLYELYVRIHQEEENDPDMSRRTRQEFRKLEEGDAENLRLWREFSDLSKQEFEKIYKMLDVSFEAVAGESFYNDMISGVQAKLENVGLLSESKEATIVDLERHGLPALLIKKSDDTTLYATRDLAAAIYRKETYNFSRMLYVVGVAQTLYFQQLFKVLGLLGFDWIKNCHHVSFGWVKLGDEMMSTRKGNIVFLEDVINKSIALAKKKIRESSPDLPDPDRTAREVGIGAVVFADLAYRRETDISFDWDRMLDFSGNSGPYLQYAHARISSVIRKYGRPLPEQFVASLLTLPEEYLIARKLAGYPEIIERAADEFEPYHISSFLLELCALFNTYYQKYKSPGDRILSDDGEKTKSRIVLTSCIRDVLRSGLSILGLKAPEMM